MKGVSNPSFLFIKYSNVSFLLKRTYQGYKVDREIEFVDYTYKRFYYDFLKMNCNKIITVLDILK